MLLTLKTEEGATSLGMQLPLEGGKARKRFSPGASRRSTALPTPAVSPVRPGSDF